MEQLIGIEVATGGREGLSLPVLKKRLLLESLGLGWTAVQVFLMLLTLYGIVVSAKEYHSHLPLPVKLNMTADRLTPNQEAVQLTKALEYLNCPQTKIASIAEGILKGAKTIGVSPRLILALLFTESEFNGKAVSPKGYKGYMQTPRASMEYADNKMGYADVDILLGCRILQEKMRSPAAKGTTGNLDMRKALAMYKGGLNPMAFRQADAVLRLYKKLQVNT
jgi:hypothetical protein